MKTDENFSGFTPERDLVLRELAFNLSTLPSPSEAGEKASKEVSAEIRKDISDAFSDKRVSKTKRRKKANS